MRRALADLTLADGLWGGGPLLFAVLAVLRAVRTDDTTMQVGWGIVAAIMTVICGVYVVWSLRHRARAVDATLLNGQPVPGKEPGGGG